MNFSAHTGKRREIFFNKQLGAFSLIETALRQSDSADRKAFCKLRFAILYADNFATCAAYVYHDPVALSECTERGKPRFGLTGYNVDGKPRSFFYKTQKFILVFRRPDGCSRKSKYLFRTFSDCFAIQIRNRLCTPFYRRLCKATIFHSRSQAGR